MQICSLVIQLVPATNVLCWLYSSHLCTFIYSVGSVRSWYSCILCSIHFQYGVNLVHLFLVHTEKFVQNRKICPSTHQSINNLLIVFVDRWRSSNCVWHIGKIHKLLLMEEMYSVVISYVLKMCFCPRWCVCLYTATDPDFGHKRMYNNILVMVLGLCAC